MWAIHKIHKAEYTMWSNLERGEEAQTERDILKIVAVHVDFFQTKKKKINSKRYGLKT